MYKCWRSTGRDEKGEKAVGSILRERKMFLWGRGCGSYELIVCRCCFPSMPLRFEFLGRQGGWQRNELRGSNWKTERWGLDDSGRSSHLSTREQSCWRIYKIGEGKRMLVIARLLAPWYYLFLTRVHPLLIHAGNTREDEDMSAALSFPLSSVFSYWWQMPDDTDEWRKEGKKEGSSLSAILPD